MAVFWTTLSSGTLQRSGMGLPAGLGSCPKGQDNSEVAAEEPSGPHQRRESALGQCRPQPPWTKQLWAVRRTWRAESVTTAWRA